MVLDSVLVVFLLLLNPEGYACALCPPIFSYKYIHPLYYIGLLRKSLTTVSLSRLIEPSDSKKMPSLGYTSKVRVHEKYKVVGFISSGTYGRVYKAVGRNGQPGDFAIKK